MGWLSLVEFELHVVLSDDRAVDEDNFGELADSLEVCNSRYSPFL